MCFMLVILGAYTLVDGLAKRDLEYSRLLGCGALY